MSIRFVDIILKQRTNDKFVKEATANLSFSCPAGFNENGLKNKATESAKHNS